MANDVVLFNRILELHCKTLVILGIFAGTIAAFWIWIVVMSVTSQPTLTPFAVRGGFTGTFGKDPMWWISLIVGLVVLGAMELIVKSLRRHRLARTFWSGGSPAKEHSDLADGDVLAGYEAWYPHLWQQIEQDPNASERLHSLLPKPEVHSSGSPVPEGKKKSRRPAGMHCRSELVLETARLMQARHSMEAATPLGLEVCVYHVHVRGHPALLIKPADQSLPRRKPSKSSSLLRQSHFQLG